MKISNLYKILIPVTILVIIVIVGVLVIKDAEWALYENETFGYEVKYPKGWTVDTGRYEGTSTQIVDPTESVWIVTTVVSDNRLTQKNGFEAVIADIEEGLKKDSRYKIDIFDKQQRDTEFVAGGYVVAGSFSETTGKNYHFEEMGILMKSDSGLVYVITVNVPSEEADQYEKFIWEVIDSFVLSSHGKNGTKFPVSGVNFSMMGVALS